MYSHSPGYNWNVTFPRSYADTKSRHERNLRSVKAHARQFLSPKQNFKKKKIEKGHKFKHFGWSTNSAWLASLALPISRAQETSFEGCGFASPAERTLSSVFYLSTNSCFYAKKKKRDLKYFPYAHERAISEHRESEHAMGALPPFN